MQLTAHPPENPTVYRMALTRDETARWARKPGAAWPCSELAGRSVYVSVDRNGLDDIAINGRPRDCDANELEALVTDHLPPNLRHLWPVWQA